MKRIRMQILVIGVAIFAQVAQAQWTPAKRLTWTSGDSYKPGIAVDSKDTLHVVWHDYTPGPPEIYYKRSTDGGTTWSAVKRLTWTPDGSYEPAIAIDSSNNLHVVWHDYTSGPPEIYYKRSTDGGATWSSAQRLTWTSASSYNPVIAIDSGGTLHVVWSEDTPGLPEIYYKKSTDGGATWSAIKRLSWTSGDSYFPALAIDSSDAIHVVWEDFTPGYAELYHKRSTDKGTTWSADKRLTSTSGNSLAPAMATASVNTLHVVWYDSTPGNDDLYYKRSTDGGLTWSADKRLTWTSGDSYFPGTAVNSGTTIHVVWHDSTPGSAELYYKRSMDGGLTWGAAQRLTWTSGNSRFPAMAVDSGNTIHVVWDEETPGNTEIYYKNGK